MKNYLKKAKKTHFFIKRIFLIFLFLFVTVAFVSNFILLLHNQAQSEYFILFDFWRKFNLLASAGPVKGYIFHHMHTFVIPSAAWYADIVFANGTLKLFHAIVLALLLVGFGGLLWLTKQMFRQATAHHAAYAWITAIAAAAIFLSPSSANWASSPLPDLIASLLLAAIALTALSLTAAQNQPRQALAHRVYISIYPAVTLIAFLTLETYAVIPLVLAIDAALRGKYAEAKPHILIVAVLVGLYGALSLYFDAGGNAIQAVEISRNLSAFLHNFLLLLASHQLFLLGWLKLPWAAQIAIGLSVAQLLFSMVFVFLHYRRTTGDERAVLFAFFLIAMGAISIALATWLRFSQTPVFSPVYRYTPYSALFSIGVFFIAVYTLIKSYAPLMRYAAALVIFPVALGLVIETGIFWMGAYNPAADVSAKRTEMAVYALSPGDERGLGPAAPDDGRPYRGRLHDFLKEHELSVSPFAQIDR